MSRWSVYPFIARRGELGKFVLRRDPRDISRIWVLDPGGGAAYIEVPYRTLSRPPISVWEQTAAVARLREFGRGEVDENALFAMAVQMRQVVEGAHNSTRRARRDRQRRADVPVPGPLPPPAPPSDQAVPGKMAAWTARLGSTRA
ncbi:Mu transposase C-terminal domain-containing protein [Actinocrinis puniceicyclus]|uniref:Mu transposase C-terminal domain-containing protein n=1 Tax=Actinocrinis puniceicyclus TaxID=977794 RepID=A0A8J7WTK9_9ACTN|nr:Mu transposase C-terminal domain-containing protein [Actinocrinis puniceicyclus]MBS2965924.1 Mu transposase C-terminal domain-containing protein [Actinocrinis puniceicyclus]